MSNIAILYTGDNQLPLIETALKSGHHVFIISFRPSIHFPMPSIYCDCTNFEPVLEFCKKNKISGLCSVASEKVVVPMAILTSRLGLTGIPLKAAKTCTNKLSIKREFQKANILFPKFKVGFHTDSINILEKKCHQIGFPVLFKPIDSSSSRGISLVLSVTDIKYALSQIKAFSKRDRFLIEKYISGESFGIEGLISKGKIRFLLPVGNFNIHNQIDIPIGHYAPYTNYTIPMLEITDKLNLFFKNCEITDSFFTIDCRLGQDNLIYFLEIGARCGGNLIPELLSHFYGTDIYKIIIKQAIGDSLDTLSDFWEYEHPCACTFIKKAGKRIKLIVCDGKTAT